MSRPPVDRSADPQPRLLEISLPEYPSGGQPDYLKVGRRVDDFFARELGDGAYLLRAISLADHPGKTIDDLVDLILASGTDRYDPKRKPVEPEFEGYEFDLHLTPVRISGGKIATDDGSTGDQQLAEQLGLPREKCTGYFAGVAFRFRELIPVVRGVSLRIDLLTVYDPKEMERAVRVDRTAPPLGALERYLYRFGRRSSKRDALLAIVKIL